MYKGTITTATAVTSGNNIAFSTVWNTNSNTYVNSLTSQLEITTSGYYDVIVNLVVTGSTATTISAQLFADGVALPEAISTEDITASTGTVTLTILDTVRVEPAAITSVADLAVRLSSDATINAGVITVEKRR